LDGLAEYALECFCPNGRFFSLKIENAGFGTDMHAFNLFTLWSLQVEQYKADISNYWI
jgi:hypothetical protein